MIWEVPRQTRACRGPGGRRAEGKRLGCPRGSFPPGVLLGSGEMSAPGGRVPVSGPDGSISPQGVSSPVTHFLKTNFSSPSIAQIQTGLG